MVELQPLYAGDAGALNTLAVSAAVDHGFSQAGRRLQGDLGDILVDQIRNNALRTYETRARVKAAIGSAVQLGRTLSRNRLPERRNPLDRFAFAVLEYRAETDLRFRAARKLRYSGL
ncbi:hypothetical protein BH09PSE1_BH09PSE1_09850 [soil metagenome]